MITFTTKTMALTVGGAGTSGCARARIATPATLMQTEMDAHIANNPVQFCISGSLDVDFGPEKYYNI